MKKNGAPRTNVRGSSFFSTPLEAELSLGEIPPRRPFIPACPAGRHAFIPTKVGMVFCRPDKNRQGQSILEFSFTMVVACLLLAGMIEVFAWTGRDMARRRQAHDNILTEDIGGTGAAAPLKQIRPTFYSTSKIDGASWPSNIWQ